MLNEVAVVYRYSTSCVENAFLARNIVDTVSRTSLSLHNEGILTVLHFATSSSSGDKNPGDLKCNIFRFFEIIVFYVSM